MSLMVCIFNLTLLLVWSYTGVLVLEVALWWLSLQNPVKINNYIDTSDLSRYIPARFTNIFQGQILWSKVTQLCYQILEIDTKNPSHEASIRSLSKVLGIPAIDIPTRCAAHFRLFQSPEQIVRKMMLEVFFELWVAFVVLVLLGAVHEHRASLSEKLKSAVILSFREAPKGLVYMLTGKMSALLPKSLDPECPIPMRTSKLTILVGNRPSFSFLRLPIELQLAILEHVMKLLPTIVTPTTGILFANPMIQAFVHHPQIRHEAIKLFLSRATLILDLPTFAALTTNDILFSNLNIITALTICLFSIQNGQASCHVWQVCHKFCPTCRPADSKRSTFFHSLPWGGIWPIENLGLYQLTELRQLTIELCDWDFQIADLTLDLIKQFLRTAPNIHTLVLRIRLKVGSHVPGLLPQAILHPDIERTRLTQAIASDIATLKSAEIFEDNRSYLSKLWTFYAPFVVTREVGAELRLTFDINAEAPAL